MSGGDFSRTPSNNDMQNVTPGPEGFWPGENVYHHQPICSNPGFGHVPPEWPAYAPRMGHGRQEPDYTQSYPQYPQGFPCDPRNISLREFDPTRPPPPFFFNQRYDETSGQSMQTCSLNPERMYHGSSVETAQHGNIGLPTPAPYFNRPLDGSSLPSPVPHFSQTGLGGRLPENGVGADRKSTDLDRRFERWPDGNVAHPPADAEAAQRRLDEKWLLTFLSNGKIKTVSTLKQTNGGLSVTELRDSLYGAVQLMAELALLCQSLKENIENEGVWTELHARATVMRSDLQHRLDVFNDPSFIDSCKKKIALIHRRRARIRRKKHERLEERNESDARRLEKEAGIDAWRMKRIQKVEERKRDLEMRQAADSVLSEVRKKQADAKRMQDVLRSLEKLRKLRKEAAARKGVHPEREADEAFEGLLGRLRQLIQKRTAVYAAEEKALRVMLEVEQEEERRREQDRRQRREREKLLLRRRQVEAALFGEETRLDRLLQPFTQYYLQAESSLHVLIQTRREWDQYLVPSDHPDGSFVPQGWVLPEPPTDEVWGTALEKQEPVAD